MPIQDLLEGQENQINYDNLCENYPWILEKNHSCVLSPDSDGLLCGLFMSMYLDWKIVGFYDGKVSVINKDYIDKNPIFLDIEIFRKEIRSMGHHMLAWNYRKLPCQYQENFENCIQPNNMREYDGYKKFRLKYPLATIHMLISIIAWKRRDIKIPDSAIPSLFFTDGVFNILFSYPENVLNWLNYLRIHEDWNPLKGIFENESSIFSVMQKMNDFFRKRDKISIKNERGDRLRISNKDGSRANIENENSDFCKISEEAKNRILDFIQILSETTQWHFKENDWLCWQSMKCYKFTKTDFKSKNMRINIENYNNFLSKNPLSWAMTSGQNIEYTLETPDELLN